MERILVDGAELRAALKKIKGCVVLNERWTTLPILACTKLEVEGNKVYVGGTNLEVYGRMWMETLEGGGDATWIVSYKDLSRFVNATMAPRYEMEFVLGHMVDKFRADMSYVGLLIIRALEFIEEGEPATINLKVWNPREYPSFGEVPQGEPLAEPGDLLSALGACLPAVSVDVKRPLLNGVSLTMIMDKDEGTWQVRQARGADGVQLAWWKRELPRPERDQWSTFIIPLHTARIIRSVFGDEPIWCEPGWDTNTRVTFRSEKMSVRSITLEGKYPDVAEIVRISGGLAAFLLNPKDLLAASRAAASVTSKDRPSAISFCGNKEGPMAIRLLATNGDTGNRVSIPFPANCVQPMKDLGPDAEYEIGVNMKYLVGYGTCLRAAFGHSFPGLVRLSIGRQSAPMNARITDAERQVELTWVVMPMHITTGGRDDWPGLLDWMVL